MNGIHDLGGMHGFGPIVREQQEPVFHSEWERRVAGLTFALGATGRMGANQGEFRHAIERMDPARYLATSYYEHWLHALETLLTEKGLVTREELEAARSGSIERSPSRAEPRAPAPGPGPVSARHRERRARFKPGDHIVTRNLNPAGHTRLPRYARGKPALIVRDLGVYAFPDTNAHGAGKNRQHAYNVRFRARDLWGAQAGARDYVHIDLWEDYLRAAGKPRSGRSRMR